MSCRILPLAALLLTSNANATDFPCSPANYRIPSVDRLAIPCKEGLAALDATARLFLVQNGSVTGSELAQGPISIQDFDWLVTRFSQAMQGGKDYEVVFTGRFRSVTQPLESSQFEKRFRFTTKPGATLTIPLSTPSTAYFYGSELRVNSNIELVQTSPAGKLIIESEDAPGVFVPHEAVFTMDRGEKGFDPIGTARITFRNHDAPKRLNARFRSTSLRDIFGQTLPLKSAKRLALPAAPKAKEDSFYYAKLLHQGGANSRPAWILDGKFAPVFTLRRLANWQFRPSAEADIGQGGAIGKTKTNDYIKLGLGLGRFIRTPRAGPIQGVDPTLGAAYETNYSGAKRNLLAVLDLRLYLAGSDQSLKQKNFIRFLKERDCKPLPPGVTFEECKKNAPEEPQDASKAWFGYKFRAFAGVEAGRQISEVTAKASEGNSAVSLPAYAIARIRPKVEVDLEFRRLTVTLSGTPRYLATVENVYREREVIGPDDKLKKEIFLATVSGWRPSGELSLSIPLDEAGHFALVSSLKLGSLPPNFQRVAIVQSGITIKF